MRRAPPRSTLFPYTTHFRSEPRPPRHEHVPGGTHGPPAGGLGMKQLQFHRVPAARGLRRRGLQVQPDVEEAFLVDRKSTRLNSSHANISYAVFCLKKKK